MPPCAVSFHRVESKSGHLHCFGIQKHPALHLHLQLHSQRKVFFIDKLLQCPFQVFKMHCEDLPFSLSGRVGVVEGGAEGAEKDRETASFDKWHEFQ